MVKKFTESLVREIVEVDTGNEYSLIHLEKTGKIDEKTGKAKKREITLKHNKCGHTYTIPLYEFTDGKRRCAKCKGEVLRKHFAEKIETIQKKTNNITDGEYSFIDDHYVNSKHKHSFKHNTCGTVFPKTWDKFRSGQRCPSCQRKGMESMASRYARDILDHFNIEYSCEERFEDCINPETGKVLPFDYYLPKINLIIEIDGEQHDRASFTPWDVEGTIKRDKIKNGYAEKKGIELVRIPAKEWSALPKFLYDILSEKLVKNLTLQDVQNVVQSTHPERITSDLKKIHIGEYVLHDNFYTGSERKHLFKHLKCGHIFETSLAYIKDNKHPCPQCRDERIKKGKHNKSNKLLIDKSNGKYCLSELNIGVDKKDRRLVHCNTCNHEWFTTVGNLMKNTGGCPNCFENLKETNWRINYDHVLKALQDGSKLDKKQKNWVWQNKRKYSEGKLKDDRVRLLKEANHNLL